MRMLIAFVLSIGAIAAALSTSPSLRHRAEKVLLQTGSPAASADSVARRSDSASTPAGGALDGLRRTASGVASAAVSVAAGSRATTGEGVPSTTTVSPSTAGR